MIGGPSFLALAKDITLGHAADVLDRPGADTPRHRFLAACLRLEAAGQEEGGAARRIYSRSALADEIAQPDVAAAGRIIRILNVLDHPQSPRAEAAAREAIAALCDLLASPL